MALQAKRLSALLLALLLLLSACAVSRAPQEEAPDAAPSPTPSPTPSAEDAARQAQWAQDAEAVLLSELMVKNRCTLQDEDGDFSDWLELENHSGRSIDLGGWLLSDKEEGGWALPELTLSAGERLLLFASGKDRRGAELHTDFSLSEGETLRLSTPDGRPVMSLTLPAAEADSSLIREADGTYAPCAWPSPGHSNDAAGYDQWQEGLTAAGPLVINEVVVANFLGAWSAPLAECDWVELRNVSDESVALSDYYLSDDRDDYLLWQLPERSLAPGELFLLACDKDGARGIDCAPFSLDSQRETLFLSDSRRVVDRLSLHDIPLGGSCGRMDGQAGFFYFSSPTPGAANRGGLRRVSRPPVSLTADGCYEDTDSLSVALSAAGTIYYTTDGSCPTEKSAVYSGPVELGQTTILRAVAVEEGGLPSRPLDLSFFLNEGHSLPVLSLVMDDYGAFQSMYNNGTKHRELSGSLALFEEDGSFHIGCGATMSGATSLSLPKKNVSVRFRGAYGSSWLHYDVFDGGVDEFTSLTIRAGQDYYFAIIRNELCQNLALAMSPDHVVTQRSKYCVLYINGSYRGLYALKEKVTRQLYASWAGVSKDSVTLQAGPVRSSYSFYQEVCAFVADHDMTQSDNYEAFCQVMDVDSLIDWLILEGYCANADILRGNVRYAKSTEGDGKWRVVFYDLDATLRRRSNTFYNLIGRNDRVNIQQISQLLLPLLKNEDFRARFLERFAEAIHGPLSDEAVLAEIDRLYALIEPELPRDFQRWGTDPYRLETEFQYMRRFVADDYARYNMETICELLRLSEEEIARYFPEL